MPWNLVVYTFLDLFVTSKANYCIIPPFNAVDATPYDIIGIFNEIPFGSKEKVIKKVSIVCITHKKITHKLLHFKQHWKFPLIFHFPTFLPIHFLSVFHSNYKLA